MDILDSAIGALLSNVGHGAPQGLVGVGGHQKVVAADKLVHRGLEHAVVVRVLVANRHEHIVSAPACVCVREWCGHRASRVPQRTTNSTTPWNASADTKALAEMSTAA